MTHHDEECYHHGEDGDGEPEDVEEGESRKCHFGIEHPSCQNERREGGQSYLDWLWIVNTTNMMEMIDVRK